MSLVDNNHLLRQITTILEKELDNEFEPNYLLKHALRLLEVSKILKQKYSLEELFGTCYLISYKFCGDDNTLYANDIARIIRSRLINTETVNTDKIKEIEIKILKIIKYDIIRALKLHRHFSPNE